MSIHVTTGNQLDIVYDYENDKQVLKGLKPWNGELIPLPNPEGLVYSLNAIIQEIKERNK